MSGCYDTKWYRARERHSTLYIYIVECTRLDSIEMSSATYLNCPTIIVENEVKPSVPALCLEFCWYSGDPQRFSPGNWSSRRPDWGGELASLQPLLVVHRGLRGQRDGGWGGGGGGGGGGERTISTKETFSQYPVQPAEPGILREDKSHHLQAAVFRFLQTII